MKNPIDIIEDIIKKDIIDMISHVKSLMSTQMTQDQVDTANIYLDTIAALISNDINAFPEEKPNA